MSRRLQLIQLLESYEPTPVEEPAHARMLVLARDPGDVLSRYHFEPGHFTVSGFMISPDGGKMLLVLHERLGVWLQPGGHVEPGDGDFVGAARREIVEETGLVDIAEIVDGIFDIDVHRIPAARGEPRHEHHDLRFLYRASEEPAAGAGIAAALWVPLDEVADLTRDRSVLRAVEKVRGYES